MYILLLFTFTSLLFPSLLFATEAESASKIPGIRGIVYDETNSPLVAATVVVEGAGIGTTTNSEGRFILKNLPKGIYRITISFIGYMPQTKTVDLNFRNSTHLTVMLLPDENMLSDIEVFGERYKQPQKLDAAYATSPQ